MQCGSPLFAAEASAAADLGAFRSLLAADFDAYGRRAEAFGAPAPLVGPVLHASAVGARSTGLECLQPISARRGVAQVYDRSLQMLQLKPGRVCAHPLCSAERCGLHVLDGVLLAEEAERLVRHGQEVLQAEDGERGASSAAQQPGGFARSRRVDFPASARLGSAAGHLLGLRTAERMRRIAAATFGLPAASLCASRSTSPHVYL